MVKGFLNELSNLGFNHFGNVHTLQAPTVILVTKFNIIFTRPSLLCIDMIETTAIILFIFMNK